MRVAILDDIHRAYDKTEAIRELRKRAEVVVFDGPFSDPRRLAGFDALIANRERTRFPRELLSELHDVRIIAQTGEHAYHIDFAAAREFGITVAKAAGGPSKGAPELTIGLMIALMRGLVQCDSSVKAGKWETPLGEELSGKTLGLVGLGNVGRQVANVANVFGMKVLAYTPTLTQETARAAGVVRKALDEVMAESDIVSIQASLSQATRGLIDARRLALMKPTAFLVNTARGPIVDEKAMVEALTSGRLRGAGLDVFDVEPLPAGHPLTKLSNVVLTPHAGWPTDGAYERFANGAAGVLIAYLDGKEVPHFPEDH